jgi:hypothetical protein
MPLGGVYKDKDLEDLYQLHGEDEEEPTETAMVTEEPEEREEEREAKKIRKREAAPALEEDEVESLKRLSPEVIGSLFDRIKFLKERVDEINDMMKSREQIHESMVKDIDEDVKEKTGMLGGITDIVDRRNVKLDISVLRKEKRSEIRQYWRDLMELRTEMQELMEQLRNETKIAGLFREGSEELADKKEDQGKDFAPVTNQQQFPI